MFIFPNGHFYSPIVSIEDVKSNENKIWKNHDLISVDLNEQEQLSLVAEFGKYYNEMPDWNSNNYRYKITNGNFNLGDTIILYSMIRHFNPKRIIEIGCGNSSMVILDVKDIFLQDMEYFIIDPYPASFYKFKKDEDKDNYILLDKPVQDIDIDFFHQLSTNDILFIDSSHVSKCGSDLNYLLFEVLPSLNSGVIIHFHDIFMNFEYPKSWIYGGVNWNESYLLKAFFMYNNSFKILHFSDFLNNKHKSYCKNNLPYFTENSGGSLWILKK